MQRAAIPARNNCTHSNVLENIHEAKVLQPMTAFGEITCVAAGTKDTSIIVLHAFFFFYN